METEIYWVAKFEIREERHQYAWRNDKQEFSSEDLLRRWFRDNRAGYVFRNVRIYRVIAVTEELPNYNWRVG